MAEPSRAVSRFIGAMAILLALIVAAAPPAIWFSFSLASLRADLRRDAEMKARLVTELVEKNPSLWRYDEARLGHVLEGGGGTGTHERRCIHAGNGTVAEVAGPGFAPPHASESSTVWDAGMPAGRVEVSGSLRPLLRKAGLLGLLSTAVSAGLLFLFIGYPVSAIRKALNALAQEKERFQETFQSISDGIVSIDSDGKVLLMNRAAESITGWLAGDATGKEIREILPFRNRDGGPVALADVASGGHGVLVFPSGDRRLVEVSLVAIPGGKAGCVQSVAMLRDVTERKRMEEEIARGQKMESLGIMAGSVAHDFNNLLTGVLGNISLAKDMMVPVRKEYRRLEEAEKATLKAKEISRRLLAFSRKEASWYRRIPVEETVRDATELAVRGTSVLCEYRSQEGLWGAFADAGRIGQVINNLAVNAVHAMPDGGVLRVAMENAEVGESGIPHVKAGKYVKITVADEGSGIPANILPRIFEPYFTTKEKGSGLGLAICYGIMKDHGGNIFAESEPGRGTTFVLYLPSTGNVVRPSAPPKERSACMGKGKVLLMDDEEALLELGGEMLARLGYDPRFARDGAEAADLYAGEARVSGGFDLVILDLTVPGGVGGKEAAARILEEDPEARILVSSGDHDDPAMRDPGKYGFAGTVPKPYQLEDLGRALLSALRSARRPG